MTRLLTQSTFFLAMCLLLPTFGWCLQNAPNPKLADSLLQEVQAYEERDVAYLNTLFQYVYNANDYSQRLAYAEEGLALAKSLQRRWLEGRFLSLIGDSHLFMGNSPLALKKYQDALEVFKTLDDFARNASPILNTIGAIYLKQEDYQRAIRYFHDAEAINLELRNLHNLAGDYSNLGEAFRLEGVLDSAQYFFEQALHLFDTLRMEQYMPYGYGNLGLVKVSQGEIEEGQAFIDQAVQLLEEFGDGYGISAFKTPLGEILLAQGSIPEAERVLLESLATAKAYQLKEQIRDACQTLSTLYEAKRDYQQAFNYQEQSIRYNDTLTNETNRKELAELRADYTIRQERLENQMALSEAQAKSRERGLVAWGLGIGLSLIGILTGILYQTNRKQYQTNQLLEEQKERIEQKSEIIEEKNHEITASIEYASRIQTAMLPYQGNMSRFFPEHFVLLKPKDIVSGDFYWMQEVGDDVLLAVGDCTGHGVPGALMSMLGMSLLDELTVRQGIVELPQLILRIHEEIHRQLQQDMSNNRDGMELSLIRYQPKSRILQFVGAKQPLVYIQKDKAMRPILKQVKGDRFFIGGDLNTRSKKFAVHEIELDKPTEVYLYTDGFQDQFGGPGNKKFQPARFRELLLSMHGKSMHEKREILDERFEAWKKAEEQLDDVLVLGFRF